jgi:hypothetical protein
MIIALDTATVSGMAFGKIGGEPQWETFKAKGDSLGEKKSRFRFWLMSRVIAIQPGLLAFEAPYVPVPRDPQFVRAGTDPSRAPKGPPPMNPATLRLLLALSGTVEEIAFERGIKCRECVSGEFVKFWTGKGSWGGRDAKKAAVMRVCRQRGYDVADDNAADSLALWHYAEFIVAPEIASRRAAGASLELPLYGTLAAPAQARIGRRVLS